MDCFRRVLAIIDLKFNHASLEDFLTEKGLELDTSSILLLLTLVSKAYDKRPEIFSLLNTHNNMLVALISVFTSGAAILKGGTGWPVDRITSLSCFK
jgi:hypothetical protein